jgi:hypothetical protein
VAKTILCGSLGGGGRFDHPNYLVWKGGGERFDHPNYLVWKALESIQEYTDTQVD